MALGEFYYVNLDYSPSPFDRRAITMPAKITFKLVEATRGWRYVCTDCALVDSKHEWDRYSTGSFPISQEQQSSHREHEPPAKALMQIYDHAEQHQRFAEWMRAHQ